MSKHAVALKNGFALDSINLSGHTLPSLMKRAADNWGGRPFIRPWQGQSFKYAESHALIQNTVARLKSLGLTKGDMVVCYSEQAYPSVFFMLACAELGVPFIPLSPVFSPAYLRGIAIRTQAKLVFTDIQNISRAREAGLEVIFFGPQGLPFELSPPRSPIKVEVGQNDLFMIQPTSGTTGEPKLVMRSHRAVRRYAEFLVPRLGETEHRFMVLPALTHALGFHMLTTAIAAGAELCLASDLDTRARIGEIRSLDPTVIPLTPRVLRSILSQAGRDSRPIPIFGPSAKFLFTAGSSGDEKALKRVMDEGLEIVEFYGSSEASLISLTPNDGWRAGTAGVVTPDLDLKLADDKEILVKTPGIMNGYFRDELATTRAFDSTGFYRTGDVGEVDEFNYVRVRGRKIDTYTSMEGSAIFPERIEALIESHSWANQAIVLGPGRPFLTALIVLSVDTLNALGNPSGHLAANAFEEIYRKVGGDLQRMNASLEAIDRVVMFRLLGSNFAADLYQQVGPGKIRKNRAGAAAAHLGLLEEMYGSVEWPSGSLGFVPGADRRLLAR